MYKKIKRYFHNLLNDPPGERFQQQFQRRRQDRKSPILKKILFIGGGIIVIAGGIVMLPLPGSGTIIIIIGLALVAQESLRLSKFLDWLEVELREYWRWSKKLWKEASVVKKFAVILFVLIILALIGWGIYWLAGHVSVY